MFEHELGYNPLGLDEESTLWIQSEVLAGEREVGQTVVKR